MEPSVRIEQLTRNDLLVYLNNYYTVWSFLNIKYCLEFAQGHK